MEVEDAKRRCNFIDYMAENSYNFRQDGISFRCILMKFTVLFRRKEDSCEGTVNIEEADVHRNSTFSSRCGLSVFAHPDRLGVPQKR